MSHLKGAGVGVKESTIQARLMARARKAEVNHSDFFWVYSYPTGLTLGYRRDEKGKVFSPQALKAKAMGLKKSLPDVVIDVSKGVYRKGWLELKRPGEKPTKEQLEMHDLLRAKGDWVDWSDDVETAWAKLCGYLEVPLDCWVMAELPEVGGFETLGGKRK